MMRQEVESDDEYGTVDFLTELFYKDLMTNRPAE
jgi:hypothetical protein